MKNGALHNVVEVIIAKPAEADDIWRVIRTSFADPNAAYTAVGQAGYRYFLEDLLEDNGKKNKVIYLAKEQGVVCAFADTVQRDDAPSFLTRIAVDPGSRGKGLARTLMEGVSRLPGHGAEWELDVFASNHKALRVYESLGFTVQACSTWTGRHFSPVNSGDDHAVDSHFDRYGFTIANMDGCNIPLAGSAARVPTLTNLADDGYLQRLARRFPHLRTAYCVSPGEPGRDDISADSFMIDQSLRMTGSFLSTST